MGVAWCAADTTARETPRPSPRSYYNGFSNKTATVIVADGFDAFRVGDSTRCRQQGGECLILGTAFVDLGISGYNTDATIHQDNFTAGAGIRVVKADTIRMENLDIRRKEFGLKLGVDPGTPFVYDHVIDVWTANNIYLSFNQYGLYVFLALPPHCCTIRNTNLLV